MQLERIEVITYSGSRGEERPIAFVLRGLFVEVNEISERWIEEGRQDRKRKRFFRIKGSDGSSHRLCYDESNGEWYYASG